MGFSLKKAFRRYTPMGQAYSAVRAVGGDRSARNDLIGGMGVPGAVAAGAMDSRDARAQAEAARRMASQNGGTVGKAMPGGMASYYDDSWGNVLGSIQGGNTTEQTLQNLLAGFKGKPGDLENFMRQAGPFIASAEAGRLRNSDAMKYLGDQGNWDQGAMAGYGAAAGQIGQQGARQTQQGQNRLAAMGLGRGSARSALAQQGMQNSAAAQGNLWSQTYQQAQQNRWNSAMGLMDAHRMISQMALGQQITPREQGEGGMSGLQAGAMAAGGIGSLLGGIGSLFGGK